MDKDAKEIVTWTQFHDSQQTLQVEEAVILQRWNQLPVFSEAAGEVAAAGGPPKEGEPTATTDLADSDVLTQQEYMEGSIRLLGKAMEKLGKEQIAIDPEEITIL